MPIPRKKSCSHCRAAKTRCSLTVPCERCSERNLRCIYETGGSRTQQNRVPTIAAAARHTQDISNAQSTAGSNARITDLTTFFGSQANGGTPIFTSPQAGTPLGLSDPPIQVADASFDFFSGFSAQGYRPSGLSVFSPSPLGDHAPQDGSCAARDLLIPNVFSSRIEDQRAEHRLLSQRRIATTDAFFTAKVLLGQIRQYPKMMMQGKKLPPFIHPRCASGSPWMDSCAAEDRHVCLPGALAVCANLVHMFYGRTPASSKFAWETIYRHQERLHQEYLRYGSDELLEAFQTTVIYLLLQAEDPDSVEINDTLSLIQTICDVAKRYRTLSDYQVEFDNPYSVDRKTWLETECARRTVCLLWIIELVLDVIIGPPREAELCGGYSNVPLPCCDRQRLWDPAPVSDAEWARRYRESLSLSGGGGMLRIRDLRSARRGVVATGGGGEEQERLAAWCEGTDEFGALVWMAGMLDRG